ncbi:uncharacterized protein LOC124263348 [Haliotis rubra]|uniref:uncharacterized protein LOC124263348 n=1 Tax=Haliotis rubra TaxID=36100 RepID=UPI001EE52BF8|nr:uncharacterized protein LOC124263348 [Haliotis rubra]
MSSARPVERQKDNDALMNSKDYQYIMATSESDMGSSTSSSTNSPRRPKAPAKKPVRVDNSIKSKDYRYIMDTSASDVSSSSSGRSRRESVGAYASPSRSCRNTPRGSVGSSASLSRSCRSSPRESPTGSDNASTEPPKKQLPGNLKKPDGRSSASPKSASDTSSLSLYPRSLTASNHSVWSSEILSSVSSDSESVFDPFVEDHLQPRPSPREPSVDAQFPVAETISEISLANNSEESWFTGSRESNSFHQEELHHRKLLLDQAWVTGDRKQSMSDWVSSVHVWDDDVASNLGVESFLTRLKTRFQGTWWRLTRGRETRVQIIKKSCSGSEVGTSGGDEDKTPRREKLQKRVQRFISRVFICGGLSQA